MEEPLLKDKTRAVNMIIRTGPSDCGGAWPAPGGRSRWFVRRVAPCGASQHHHFLQPHQRRGAGGSAVGTWARVTPGHGCAPAAGTGTKSSSHVVVWDVAVALYESAPHWMMFIECGRMSDQVVPQVG